MEIQRNPPKLGGFKVGIPNLHENSIERDLFYYIEYLMSLGVGVGPKTHVYPL